MPNALTALCGATIFTGEALVEGHALVLKDSKVLDITAQGQIPSDTRLVDCKDLILAPGFIDAQVNGGGNLLFNNDPTPETCITISRAHQKYGTTRLLLTLVTDKPEITEKAVLATREARKICPNILGIHIEGPHLSLEHRGVHKASYIRALIPRDLQLYRPEKGEIMLMTLAPENVPPEQIKALRNQGMIISLGHTSASPDQIHAALAAGATGFTHLYNAMGKPGTDTVTPADTALKDAQSWCGIIVDGFHVSKELVLRALKSKQQGKLFLVSNAMPPAASSRPQSFQLYGETVNVENGRCVNKEGKLAGSAVTLLDTVRKCVDNVGVDLTEALRMASSYPAAFLGVDHQFGKLLPGYEADILALTPELKLKDVWVGGQNGSELLSCPSGTAQTS